MLRQRTLKLPHSCTLAMSVMCLALTCLQASISAQHYGPRFGRKVGLIKEEYGARYDVKLPLDSKGRDRFEQARFWWVDLPWTGNDAPYAQAQNEIDVRVRQGARPVALLAGLRRQSDADKTNALKFFRWMYASWLARKQAKTRPEGEKSMAPIADRVFRLDFPRTYRYARLAFLTQAYTRPSRHQEQLGSRLLKRDPNDEPVRFYMVRVAAAKAVVPQLRQQAKQQSLAYLRYFQKKYPRNGAYDREEAMQLEHFWYFDHQRRDAEGAIQAYRRYLSKTPNATDKKNVLADIKYLSQQQELWDWSRLAQKAKAEGRPQPPLPVWFQKQVNANRRKKAE